MRRAHTKHVDYCTCGKVVRGNGGKARHRRMHAQRRDGHHAIIHDEWILRFGAPEERTAEERRRTTLRRTTP